MVKRYNRRGLTKYERHCPISDRVDRLGIITFVAISLNSCGSYCEVTAASPRSGTVISANNFVLQVGTCSYTFEYGMLLSVALNRFIYKPYL